MNGERPLPPASSVAPWTISQWRPADAAAALSRLPPEHQATVLAPAPWRTDDLAPQSPHTARLLVAWNGMTVAASVDLATALPQALAVVAAAARLGSSEPSIAAMSGPATAAAVDTLETLAQRDAAGAAARTTVGRMLTAPGRRRTWMRAFVPTDADPPEAWNAWHRAARRGAVPDRAVVLRLTRIRARR